MQTKRHIESRFPVRDDVFGLPGGRGGDDPGFLGRLQSDTQEVEAGSWQEIRLTYVAGRAGLVKGGSFKVILRSDSDWADFQTEEPGGDNYLSAELALSVSSSTDRSLPLLATRYDASGDRKSIQVTVLDGNLLPGEAVHLRLGDRRFGGRGARVQTFAEERFLWKTMVDVDGISGDVAIDSAPELAVTAGPPSILRVITAPAARAGTAVPVLLRVEDFWGNAAAGVTQRASLEVCDPAGRTSVSHFEWGNEPWAIHRASLSLEVPGQYQLRARSETCATEFFILAQKAPEETQSRSALDTHFSGHPDSGAHA